MTNGKLLAAFFPASYLIVTQHPLSFDVPCSIEHALDAVTVLKGGCTLHRSLPFTDRIDYRLGK